MYTYISTSISMSTYRSTFQFIHMWYIYICICIYVYSYRYVHAHTHTHTCTHIHLWRVKKNDIKLVGSGQGRKHVAAICLTTSHVDTKCCRIPQRYFHCMSHVTVNESCRTYKWVMTLIWMSHVTHIMSTPSHSCRRHMVHDSFKWVSWPIHMCDMTHSLWHDSFMRHYSFKWVSWLIYVSWLLQMSVMTHHLNESWHICHSEWVMSHIWMSHGTHLNESYHTHVDASCRCCRIALREIHYMRHVTVNASCHIWMRHVTLMSTPGAAAAFYTEIANVWVMSRVNSSRSYVNESCHMWMRHVTLMSTPRSSRKLCNCITFLRTQVE